MTTPPFRLKNAPIVEAILDVECDMPPKYSLADMEAPASEIFKGNYPKLRKNFLRELTVQVGGSTTRTISGANQGLQSLRFSQADDKQLVQVRSTGYSFNRLAPYGGFDDYLPEIEKTWRTFVDLTKPVQIRSIRLRYINRFVLPLENGGLDLDQYFRIGPRLADENRLTLSGFLSHNKVDEVGTNHRGTIVLTSQANTPAGLQILLDITVEAPGKEQPSNWDYLLAKIAALRSLKNTIFKGTLTDKCLANFQ